ncbi:sensor histidine kinase [Nonomuraea sp. NPDC050790]|uniref:sensor histidine kinase n=1 Tax=Nonomuraea sp. NPDC050790 TaxID=3364371 RepID=UPI0037B07CAE
MRQGDDQRRQRGRWWREHAFQVAGAALVVLAVGEALLRARGLPVDWGSVSDVVPAGTHTPPGAGPHPSGPDLTGPDLTGLHPAGADGAGRGADPAGTGRDGFYPAGAGQPGAGGMGAGGMGAGGMGAGGMGAGPGGGRAMSVLVAPLLALATTVAPVLLRGQRVAAAALVSVSVVLSLLAFQTLTAAAVGALLLACYQAGRSGPATAAVAVAAPYPVMELAATAGAATATHTLVLACLAPATALAAIARRARAEAREHTQARQVIAESLLEHTARGERARIARELHDVVAHHISMVAVQAETARVSVAGMPAAGAQRLSAIGDTARAALTEMRRLLGVLREDTGRPAARRPQPGLGLAELNELLDEARQASGTGLRLILDGVPVALDPGVELAAYRIIQEALTNARRHAPGAAVDVRLHYSDQGLRLSVRDNGPGPAGGDGLGLAGMRERAAAVGGRLSTGAAPGGGFLVEARLPGKDGP